MASLLQSGSLRLLLVAAAAMGADRPSILFILSDDYGAHEVGHD